MNMIKTPVNGMKDIEPREMEIRQFILSKIRKVYSRFGFTEIETPNIEHIENLLSEQGWDNEKLIFKILKRGEKLDKAFDLLYAKAREFKGQVSGEHGIGYAKKIYLEQQLGNQQIELMKGIKKMFDLKNILNPGKVID